MSEEMDKSYMMYIDSRIASIEKLTDQKFKSQEKAIVLAHEAMEIRLEKLNELRSEVLQDRARYTTVEYSLNQNEAMNIRIKQLELWQSKMYGAIAMTAIISGTVVGILSKFTW